MSVVTAIAPASSTDAAAWFRHKLSLETDCADVYSAMHEGEVDFVLLHVVGSEETFARRHLPGALHLPHRQHFFLHMALQQVLRPGHRQVLKDF